MKRTTVDFDEDLHAELKQYGEDNFRTGKFTNALHAACLAGLKVLKRVHEDPKDRGGDK